MPVAERETLTRIAPFSVQADHHNNSDLLLQSIPGCRLRSTITATRVVVDQRTGETRIPVDRARHLGQLPTPIPGMVIALNPNDCTYTIVDPLHGDAELCERLRLAINRDRSIRVSGKLSGVKPLHGSLDQHRMKTLCRELLQIVASGDAVVVKGAMPTEEQVAGMPGKFLLNPGSQVRTSQPRFEEDLDEWADGLDRRGG